MKCECSLLVEQYVEIASKTGRQLQEAVELLKVFRQQGDYVDRKAVDAFLEKINQAQPHTSADQP